MAVTLAGRAKRSGKTDFRAPVILSLAFIGLMFSPGPLFHGSWGVITQSLENEFGWGRAAVMAAMSWMTVGMIVAAPLAGMLIDRIGARRLMLISTILLIVGLGTLALGTANIYLLYFIACLIGFFTIGAQSISYMHLLSTCFHKHYGLAVGIAAAGLGAGYMFMATLVSGWIDAGGRSQAFFCQALLVAGLLLYMCIVFLCIKGSPAKTGKGGAAPEWQGLSWQEARCKREFWIILIVIGIFSAILTGLIPHIVLIGQAAALDAGQLGGLMQVFGFTVFLVRFLVGFLLDRFFAPYVALCFFFVAITGLVLLASNINYGVLLFATALVAAGFGAESDLIPYFIRRYFGKRAYGKIYAVVFMSFLAGAGLGPWIIGLLYEHFAGYRETLQVLAVISLGPWLLLWWMRAYRHL